MREVVETMTELIGGDSRDPEVLMYAPLLVFGAREPTLTVPFLSVDIAIVTKTEIEIETATATADETVP